MSTQGYSKKQIKRMLVDSSSYAITASYALNGGGGGGTPGGSNTQIQYNNAGAFGGVPVLTYNGSILSATGSFTGSFTGNFTGTASYVLSASHAQTASYVLNAQSASYVLSSSYATTASYALNGGTTTGSFTGSFTGSLSGTASYALTTSFVTTAQTASYVLNAVSASYALSSSFATSASFAISSSFATSASNARSSSFANVSNNIIIYNPEGTVGNPGYLLFSQILPTANNTGQIQPNAIQNVGYDHTTNILSFTKGASSNNPLFNLGTAAQNGTLNISGSINIYNSGSSALTISGSTGPLLQVNDLISPNIFTVQSGSIPILNVDTGSKVVISGSLNVTSGITGSLFGTSSWALNTLTASFVTTAQTASYVLNAQTASFVTTSQTASYVLSSSYALSASYAPPSNPFPFTGSATISGSLTVNGPIRSNIGLSTINYFAVDRWNLFVIGAPTLTTVAMTSGSANGITTLLTPFVVAKNLNITSMSFEVTALTTGTTASLGIYNSDPISYNPQNLIASCSNIIVSSTGTRSGSLNQTLALTPGLYYTAIQHSGSNSITCRSTPTANLYNVLGLPTPGNTTIPSYIAGVRSAGTFDFLPTTSSAFVSINRLGATSLPSVWIRVVS